MSTQDDALREMLERRAQEDESLPGARSVLWDDCAELLGVPDTPKMRARVRAACRRANLHHYDGVYQEGTGRRIGFRFIGLVMAMPYASNRHRLNIKRMKRHVETIEDVRRMPGVPESDKRRLSEIAAAAGCYVDAQANAFDPPKVTEPAMRLVSAATHRSAPQRAATQRNE